jgi:hypothetical protein
VWLHQFKPWIPRPVPAGAGGSAASIPQHQILISAGDLFTVWETGDPLTVWATGSLFTSE